ncbi:hypothetical protein ACIO3O_32690 [Streptomyces sp. NPDC087440]|uniref:hypothetical protein n=1 Tax=Streptomyces sp. NPDC087440 TaxID=3365790 RepID=UPI00381AD4FD
MRLRHTVGAALGALALVLTVPTSASAIDGSFYYQYGDPANPTAGSMESPDAAVCINVPEVEGKPDTAFAPKNNVLDSEAMVYSEENCEGVGTKLNVEQELGSDVKFKSVIFEAV